MGAFAAEWAGEFAVVTVFLVAALRHGVVFNTLFAESVQAVKTARHLVRLQADLADEELIVDLLCQARSRAGCHLEVASRSVFGGRTNVTGERAGRASGQAVALMK